MLQEGVKVYLIFNSDRVFYVTISEVKETEKKTWIRFAEDGVTQERPLHKEVIVAVDPEEETEDDDELDELIDAPVYYRDVLIGRLDSYFYNNAQYVLEVETEPGIRLLVPYVDFFVQIQAASPAGIYLQNADSLLESCGLGIEAGTIRLLHAD